MTRIARRTVLRAAAALAAPGLVRVRAQTRMRRIGVLSRFSDPGAPPPGASAAWKKLGWIEGETLRVPSGAIRRAAFGPGGLY